MFLLTNFLSLFIIKSFCETIPFQPLPSVSLYCIQVRWLCYVTDKLNPRTLIHPDFVSKQFHPLIKLGLSQTVNISTRIRRYNLYLYNIIPFLSISTTLTWKYREEEYNNCQRVLFLFNRSSRTLVLDSFIPPTHFHTRTHA